MSKRRIYDDESSRSSSSIVSHSHPPKRSRKIDRLSSLSDELLLHILSCLPIPSLIVCQRLSRRFHALAGDSELWKRQYYSRWVRPRARRLANSKRISIPPSKAEYSPRVSTWLDHSYLEKEGRPTNWKRQYHLRHNWSKGICRVTEYEFPRPPRPPLFVEFCAGFILTADSDHGLRAWIASNPRSCVANIRSECSSAVPTALSATRSLGQDNIEVAVGFQDKGFSVYDLDIKASKLSLRFIHSEPSPETITAMASSAPYLLTVSKHKVLSLYRILPGPKGHNRSGVSDGARLIASLKADNIVAPMSLSIRVAQSEIIASIVYSFYHIGCGWSLGIQELRLNSNGQQIDSRLATTVDSQYGISPLPSSENGFHSAWDYQAEGGRPFTMPSEPSILHQELPTSLSYRHPFLLASHPDNTLTVYLIVSTSNSLYVKSGQRLWGHTSSVGAVQVSDRGKAISVSSRGDEIRVWELESVISSPLAQRTAKEASSIRLSPENARTEWHEKRDRSTQNEIERATIDVSREMARIRGCIGFDDERVLLLREQEMGTALLESYNFI